MVPDFFFFGFTLIQFDFCSLWQQIQDLYKTWFVVVLFEKMRFDEVIVAVAFSRIFDEAKVMSISRCYIWTPSSDNLHWYCTVIVSRPATGEYSCSMNITESSLPFTLQTQYFYLWNISQKLTKENSKYSSIQKSSDSFRCIIDCTTWNKYNKQNKAHASIVMIYLKVW